MTASALVMILRGIDVKNGSGDVVIGDCNVMDDEYDNDRALMMAVAIVSLMMVMVMMILIVIAAPYLLSIPVPIFPLRGCCSVKLFPSIYLPHPSCATSGEKREIRSSLPALLYFTADLDLV